MQPIHTRRSESRQYPVEVQLCRFSGDTLVSRCVVLLSVAPSCNTERINAILYGRGQGTSKFFSRLDLGKQESFCRGGLNVTSWTVERPIRHPGGWPTHGSSQGPESARGSSAVGTLGRKDFKFSFLFSCIRERVYGNRYFEPRLSSKVLGNRCMIPLA